MSVLGIDLGYDLTVVATVGKGAVTTVRNEVSERMTPSLVAFTEKERLLGDMALASMKSNYKNTCRGFKNLLGRSNDQFVQREMGCSAASIVPDPITGLAAYKVTRHNEPLIMDATKILAAFLTKIRRTAEAYTEGPVRDAVITVPGSFKDINRQAVIDAASAAGLNCTRTMNDHAAVMLDYGIYRARSFSKEEPCRVAFVNIGYANTSVSVGEFHPGELRVLSACYDSIGCREMDDMILNKFASAFQKKFGLDPRTNGKARMRMQAEAAKCKKILSANNEVVMSLEYLVDDQDFSLLFSRAEFEEMCDSLQRSLTSLISRAIVQSGLQIEQIGTVEVVGGGSRVPWVQQTIQTAFHKELSRTMDADETAARGAALQAAMLNPRYKVREFAVHDKYFQHVCLNYHATTAAVDNTFPVKTYTLFEPTGALNLRKFITFQRDDSFDVWTSYDSAAVATGGEQHLRTYRIECAAKRSPQPGGVITSRKIKVRALLSLHGITTVDSATLIEEENFTEKVKEKRPIKKERKEEANSKEKETESIEMKKEAAEKEKDAAEKDSDVTMPPSDAAAAKPEDTTEYEQVEVMKESTRTHRTELCVAVMPAPGWLTPEQAQAAVKFEESMAEEDNMYYRKLACLNELEAYTYQIQRRVEVELNPFIDPTVRENYQKDLSQVCDWIYDCSDSASEQECAAKLAAIKSVGDLAAECYSEHQTRAAAVEEMKAFISFVESKAKDMTIPEYEHVPAEPNRTEVLTKADATLTTLDREIASQEKLPLFTKPVLTKAKIEAMKSELMEYTRVRMEIPKPKPPPAPKAEAEATNNSGPSDMDLESGVAEEEEL